MSEGRAPHRRYTVALAMAVAAHAAILFGIVDGEPYTPPEFGVEAGAQGIEVDLVAALPAEAPEQPEPAIPAPPEPPEPPTPTPETTPEPAIPEPTPPEPALPKPVVEPETPVPAPLPSPPAQPRPRRETTPFQKTAKPKPSHPSGDGSSAVPGQDAITARAATGALSSQPGYLRNPHPAYPEEARKAGQHGVVLLRVKLDDRGRVISVTIARSSGHPLLDERASSTVQKRWAFRPARMGQHAVASEVTIPIRFTLD